MLLQMQHFRLSYLKTLSVGPAGVSYRTMLEIFNNQTFAKTKYNWPKGTRSANELNDANSNERLVTGLSPVHSQSFSVALNLYF